MPSQIYNPNNYPKLGDDGYLTYEYAQTQFLPKNDIRLSYLSTLSPGTAQAGKVLTVDSSKDISGINALSCTSLTVNGSGVATSGDLTYISSITPGTATASKALVVNSDKDISSIRNLTATTLTGTLQTAAQTNITSVGTLSSIATSSGLIISRTTNGQAINSTNGTSTCVLYHTTNGTAYFGPTTAHDLSFQTGNTVRMTIASTGAISGISSLSATTLTGTLS